MLFVVRIRVQSSTLRSPLRYMMGARRTVTRKVKKQMCFLWGPFYNFSCLLGFMRLLLQRPSEVEGV